MKSIKRSVFFTILSICLLYSSVANAATLSLSPSTGTFSVGSTFSVSIILDTEEKYINAIGVDLSYPPDMLQIVSPSLGQSVIGVWTSAPKFDNINGRLSLEGGIPRNGINASNALISSVTFRVKSVGSAIVKFLDKSRALLADGKGTNALSQTESAIFQLRLPPPAGPVVVSDTNPDQSSWYSKRTVSFRFDSESTGVDGYSYLLSDESTTIPDNINRGTKNSVTYTDVQDGIHFFHIKSLRDGVWGGTTHYSVKIDSEQPAGFKINVSPSSHTANREPVIQFTTTDALSGLDHYELKLVPLTSQKPDTLFIETQSPYISSPLDKGTYDVIIRAYDKAHNFREVTQRLVITDAIFSFIDGAGIRFGDAVLPWLWVWIVLAAIIGGGVYGGYKVRRWHSEVHEAHEEKKLPEVVVNQLEELKKYRAKYGGTAFSILLFFMLSLLSASTVQAADVNPLSPPVITTISQNISNEEIFYLGGKTDVANENVVIYLQNLDTGATISETTESDKDGNWFYRHSGFLSPGKYRLWVQGKVAEEMSPPGPQTEMVITRTAIQFGPNRLSYETIYLGIIFIMVLAIIGLVLYIIYHYYQGRRKHKLFLAHVSSAEESIRRGFALLRRDIEAELAVVKKAALTGELSQEEKEKEERLLRDLSTTEQYIGKEVWDLEKAG